MKYFTIQELTRSSTAEKKNIDNTPNETVVENLTKLVDNVLDPLRIAYNNPINITSGYRSEALNKAVNGAKTSQHLKGQAADIYVSGGKEEIKKLFDLIIELDLPFDQLIDEKDYSWVHVSYNENNNRKQILHLKQHD